MKKLLLTSTAVALMGLTGAASAQSVLERVLNSINTDNMLPVTGTFANIAENVAVLGGGTQTLYRVDGNLVSEADAQAAYDAQIDLIVAAGAAAAVTFADPDGAGPSGAVWRFNGVTYASQADATAAYRASVDAGSGGIGEVYQTETVDLGQSVILNNIDGSVTNVLTGVTDATASVGGTVLAIDQVKVDIGNVSTTVLGAVNTGTTSLGVNSDYNRAIAGTSSAVSGKVLQLGGIADQTALVLNVASNATSVVGSVTNTFTALNGSVGNIGTTVLGAVNTGTISSGVNAATNGIVSGIVGTTTP